MPFVLSLLAPLIPYVLGAIAIIAVYFGIKHKGAKAEREKWQKKAEAVAESFKQAASKDEEIDAKVRDQIEAIKKTESDPPSGDRFHF